MIQIESKKNFYLTHLNEKIRLEQFFLGLLEGDGSIQVNHLKKKYLQYRIIIKLKYTKENYDMLSLIRDSLQIMNLHIRNSNIIFVEDNSKKMYKIMTIIDKHGLLTLRKRQQYVLFCYCLKNSIKYTEYKYLKENIYTENLQLTKNLIPFSHLDIIQNISFPN
jgi:hypothetical protein